MKSTPYGVDFLVSIGMSFFIQVYLVVLNSINMRRYLQK